MNIRQLIASVIIALSLSGQNALAQEYPKVILRGDYPDPSIVRDGEDYYMTHSPFIYSPGFLIWHSKDLVNWEPICRALMSHTGSAMAPDLIKYKNKFYIYYPASETNYVIWADNIRGPWSKPIDLKVTYIDPGHSVDENGKRYLHLSGGHVVQLSDDGLSTVGEVKKEYEGWDFPNHWVTEGKWLESPKVVKKGEYYYLTTAEGGTAGPPTSHMVVSARSKNILGPWENSPNNPIVHTYNADEKWWSKGHGTIIDDVNGNWWIVYHAYENGAYTLGRQTLLEPIEFTADGWFHAVKRTTPITPKGTPVKHGIELSDNFSEKNLGLQWTSWYNFDPETVFLKNESLYLKGKGTNPKDAQLLLTTATDKNYEAQVEVTLNKGSIGGLTLFYSEKAFAGISSDGKQFTIYENADNRITKPNKIGNHFFLKIINTHDVCDILISKDNKTWETLYTGLDVTDMHHNKYKKFFALRIGLMAAGNADVKFNNFVYKPQTGYLFAYFTDKRSNRNGLHLASSKDGYKWTSIGPEYSFLRSNLGDGATGRKMRDPFIMQGPDGLFHCIWTTNWEENTIGYASSKDLINWSRQKAIPVMNGFEAKNCWAPEMIYDDVKQQYVIFWSSTIKVNGEWRVEQGKKYDNRIYYTTTKDFKNFAPAQIFFDPGHNVIDATVKKINGKFYMIYKDERELPEPQKNLLAAVSDKIEGPYKLISDKPFTKNWVEGPAINQLPDNSFLVYMDSYKDHRYEAKQTNDFIAWKDVSEKISFPEGTKHGSVVPVTLDFIDNLVFEHKNVMRQEREKNSKDGVLAPKPLFRDPVYDGAADPIVIWNPQVSKWWMFYTNRRANQAQLPNIAWVHGSPIGIAESSDGANWSYLGIANFPDLPSECGGKDTTLWAPDIVQGDDGKWHMYLTIVPGVSTKWNLPGFISHLTSTNLRDWKYESKISQLGTRVLDADIIKMDDGKWRMYYKHQNVYSSIKMIESKDLYTWSDPKEALKINGEGPISFKWKGYYWLIIDTWNGQTVHRSIDGNTWEVQPGSPLLPDGEGIGKDDTTNALHANIVISNNRAYLYYFTHGGRVGPDKNKDGFEQRRTSIQVVELEMNKEGWISANRNQPTYVQLFGPSVQTADITVDLSKEKEISNTLFGAFFEDINYSADGGLYAELIQNRSFEYRLSDTQGRDPNWNSTKSWKLIKFGEAQGTFATDSIAPFHKNNPHYAILNVETEGKGIALANEGFDGIVLKAGDKYNFSMLARVLSGKNKKLTIHLVDENGQILATSKTEVLSGDWKKYSLVLTSKGSTKNAHLEIMDNKKGSTAIDVVSLFPQKTFKNRPNGLRADLAQTIADLKPGFLRFPGGCLAHGFGVDNFYKWKNTVGPIEERIEQKNLAGYHQTGGLGYFEYFQFCEDIGAMPLPVVAAGVSCQNSPNGGQKGLPINEMDHYIEDISDLIEYANGDITTKWGKVRAEAGHPAPFNMKYIGLGNEDLISDAFEERFTMIFKAMKEKHPEITVIGTVGPNYFGTDYAEGWAIADKLNVPIVDEHYYLPPGWFVNNQNFYDSYPRSGSKVYLGEYASGDHSLLGNYMYNAISEAAYMTSLERNGDIVHMSSYAPLLAKENHTTWRTDLVFFNNDEVKPTPNYYVQKLFGENSGEKYITSNILLSNATDASAKRMVCSVVKDSASGDLIVKLVNLLPDTVNANVNLQGDIKIVSQAIKTVFSGNQEDTKVKPVTSNITVDNKFSCELPANSLTVVRIKTIK